MSKERKRRGMAKLLSPRAVCVSTHLPGLVVLEKAFEFPALLFGEDLFHAGAAIAQHGAVVLPAIVKDGFHLLLLRGREIQLAPHPRKVLGLARRSVEC